MPGGKSLFLLAQEKEPKEGHPDIPEFPKIKRVGWAAKNSPRFCWADFIFVSGAQTPLPLIHPPHLIFGGSVRGEKSKPVCQCATVANLIECFAVGLLRPRGYSNRPVITDLVLIFPSQSRRKSSLPGGSAAKVFEPSSQKTN
ncbi:MAG: hypothetical protein HY018_11355 [Hydrogenophilales bacterium]|nr:hypothetical protein [Hydrogenophilales bacterium]